jgi:hypothetical protein
MNNLKQWLMFVVLSGMTLALNAKEYVPEGGAANPTNNNNTTPTGSYRASCAQATAQTDLNINNVRARLLNGGDMWWDFDRGRYIVPNVEAGQQQVSSIFAGAIWLGGFDDGGNLKMAAQTYRSRGNDYWPGPLEVGTGETTSESCENWDRHFTVYGADIYTHISNFLDAESKGETLNRDQVPTDLRRWPARGNEEFADFYGWDLPDQTLAPFYDDNSNGIYDPENGDFPIIEVRGCEPGERNGAAIADQMIYWVYNDNGNIHTQTTGDAIRMEVHVLAFGYSTSDEVNDMTFYRHKLVNRANSAIDSTHFSMWIDPDLGCYTDDLIGSDVSRSLAVVYNFSAVDGAGGCGGTPSYGNNVPMLGVDYFRGPLDENGNEIGMSAFTYYNSGASPGVPTGTTDPNTAVEYYNYMTGRWRDGLPFVTGGNGYSSGGTPTNYVFPDDPTNGSGWSMCTGGVAGADIRTLQTSGPFRLNPGAINELIIGVAWVPDIQYPCPNFRPLLQADDLAQALFDNCFKITDGPDAPDMDIVELDKELILILSNDTLSSNNARLAYQEADLQAPPGTPDSVYRFEGYKIYQLAGPNVGTAELEDADKARLVFQVDLNNGVKKIFNWEAYEDPDLSSETVYVPSLKVEGADKGIQHTFRVTEDQFATSERALINHKKYYFLAVSYAYNEYEPYDPSDRVGQRTPYLQGRRNIGADGLGTPYIGIPRINNPEYAGTKLNAAYGDGPIITRVDGQGSGGLFLDLNEETKANIVQNGAADVLTYKGGAGPINVKIVDPLRVKGGEYSLTIIDNTLSNNTLDNTARWVLSSGSEQWFSELPITSNIEQVIFDRGISISIGQVDKVGTDISDPTYGLVGGRVEYSSNNAAPWLGAVPPGQQPLGFLSGALDFMQTASSQADEALDPNRAFFKGVLEGQWVPYTLCNWRQTFDGNAYDPYLTPAWVNTFGNLIQTGNPLSNLNNVDIVFTPDKTKWSRCVVVESGNVFHAQSWATQSAQMKPRTGASLGTDGQTDNTGTTGMSWFPGYAINVETGERLNIFFGENSVYDGAQLPLNNGADMIWNPSSTTFEDLNGNGFPDDIAELVMGGQHFIYVTNTKYDGCADLRTRLGGSSPQVVGALRQIQWTTLPILPTGTSLKSIADGIIPSEVSVKLRVSSPYAVSTSTGAHPNNGYPQYSFSLDNFITETQNATVAETSLDLINVVPNPYYAYSTYEARRSQNIVKITNVPAKCTITIYSLDGKFIRQYERDENPGVSSGALAEQIVTSVEWDLKNSKGIPVAAGVYLIHVNVPGVGERVIKWFGINRTFDAQDL